MIDETIEMLVMREETEDYAFEGDSVRKLDDGIACIHKDSEVMIGC